MKRFIFNDFLIANGYKKEEVKDGKNKICFTNYQKEVKKGVWNCITITKNKLTASSPLGNLEYVDVDVPKNEETAMEILKTIEIV